MILSDLAKKIWPYLRPNVEQAVTRGVVSAGGGVSGGSAFAGIKDPSGAAAVPDGLSYISLTASNQVSITAGANSLAFALNPANISHQTLGGRGADDHHAAFVGLKVGATTVSPDAADVVTLAAGSSRLTITPSGSTITVDVAASPSFTALAVSNNITVGGTVDGVDVAALSAAYTTHAANANAHHNQQHALVGSDHTASGLTVGYVVRASGATSFAWAQLQHSDLGGVSSDQHVGHSFVSVLAGSGLTGGGTIVASRTLNVGAGAGITVNADDVALTTPGSLSATSTNSSTGNHTHAIDATIARSAIQIIAGSGLTGGGDLTANRTLNVGAGNGISVAADSVAVNQAYDFSWTGLHTFNEHTEMESVDVNGALTVFDDLSVFYGGYYPLFVNVDTVNPNNSNVGIMTNSPDPQFALDVNGPARARYFIGPHALQLDDAAMIVHFDGPTPYNTNFDGSAVGHLGQVPTISGGVIFGEGKFGKAVQVAEATTNYVSVSSFELTAITEGVIGSGGSVLGWSVYSSPTVYRSDDSVYGSISLGMTTGATSTPYIYKSAIPDTLTTGDYWTFSAYVKAGNIGAVGNTATLYLRENGDNDFRSSAAVSLTDEWQRVVVTRQLTSASFTSLNWYIVHSSTAGGGDTILIDGIQLEKKAYATPYCDGSLGDGHSWSGTAHASTSSRTASSISYDNSILDPNEGTVGMWVKWNKTSYGPSSADYDVPWECNYGTGLMCYAYWNSTEPLGRITFYGGGVSSGIYHNGISSGDWYHVVCTWSKSDNVAAMYLDGQQVATGTFSGTNFGTDTFNVGFWNSGSQLNGLIDDLVILSRAATADEIRAIYESNAPVFAESSITAWRTPSQVPIWVDSEGLWMRATGGGETLGAYGGDATKSWGGKTLYRSDFLLGNATDGYIHWHAFQDDADPWGAAGMEVKAQINITGNSQVTGWLDVSGELSVTDGTTKLQATQDALLAGSHAGGSSTSFAVIFADSTQVGTDPMSPIYDSGDVLIGDELNANILWDQSAGQLLFRDNTTIQAYVDTDGSIKAGGGAVTLDDGGFRLAVGTGTPNRIRWMNSTTERSSINGFDSGGIATVSVLSGQNVATAYPGSVSLYAYEGGGSLGFALFSLDGPGNQAVVQFDDTDGRFRVQQTGPTVWLEVGPTNAQFAGALTLTELSSTPSTPTDGTQMRAYMKADKFVIQYNDGGTVRYKYLSLTSTGVTWVHTTTAP